MFTPVHVPSAPYTCAVYMEHDAAKPHQQCPCRPLHAGGAADRLRAFPMAPAYSYTGNRPSSHGTSS
jgi:hypothetical protein